MSIRLLLQAATYADQPIRQKYHFHNSYELIFIRKGAIRLTVEQKQYIMSAGSLAIISCLENHSTEILSKEYERYYILIYSNRLDAVVSDAALSSIFRNRPFAFNHVVDMTASFDAIDRCFRAIIDEYNQPKDYSRLLLTSYLNEILVHVFRTVPSDLPPFPAMPCRRSIAFRSILSIISAARSVSPTSPTKTISARNISRAASSHRPASARSSI